MTTPEQPRGDVVIEQRSSVKISTTAKGDPQVEVKVVDGTPEAEILRLEQVAVNTYKRVREAVTGGAS